MGALTITQEDQKELKDYLLGRLGEAGEERVENRLLADQNYSRELHIITDELIGQYAYDRIAAEDREVVEKFIFGSEDRYKKLRFALALKKRAAESKWKSRLLYVYLPIAASILLVVGLGVWWKFFNRSDVDEGLLALRTAYRDQRSVDARVTDFPYAPLSRGEERVDSLQRDLAMSILTRAAVEHPDALSQYALGQYYLTQQQFDKAVEQLQASVTSDGNNAKAHNDLGVALLEQGRQAEANNDRGLALKRFVESHEHLKKAVELDNTLLEARFNLSLVLEKMVLPDAAAESWRKYLEQDPSSPWSNEARQKLRVLEEKQKANVGNNTPPDKDFLEAHRNRDDQRAWLILSRNREVVAGKFIPTRLVSAYLDHATRGRANEAAAVLDALEYAGELETQKSGDRYTSAVARFYRSASPGVLASLREAHRLAGEGFELCRNSGFPEAVRVLEKSQALLKASGDEPEVAFVSYWLAFSYRHSQHRVESRAIADRLLHHSKEKNYKWLQAQVLGLISNLQTSTHEQSAVLRLDHEALSLTQEVNDSYGTQKYLASLAGKYAVLYNFTESLDHLARCLTQARESWAGSRQTWRNYDTATQLFNRMGLYTASAAYGEEALRLALKDSTDPSFIYLSYVHLGVAYGRLNNFAEGIKHAQAGMEIGQKLTDERVGKEIMAYSALQLGDLHRQHEDFQEAGKRYDQAIQLYEQLSFHTFKFAAHRGRLLTYLAQGDDAATQRELDVLFGLFEEYRSKIEEDDNRTYFFDVTQEIYDAAIEFAHSRLKNNQAAFAYSEDSRARSLFAMIYNVGEAGLTTNPARPYNYLEIQQRLPEQTQIVQYAVLKDRILIWVISRDEFWPAEKIISSETLNKEVRSYLGLVSRPSTSLDELRVASASLYQILIAPIQGKLVAGKTLCVVPDKILNHLPFETLVSNASGRYLISDHAVVFSPSSSVFIVNSEAAQTKQALDGEKLLSIGNPGFDRQAFPSLPDLPSAAAEAETISRYYVKPTPLVLTGSGAGKDRVIKAIADADVLHFASHYVVDERSPLRSQLLLSRPDSLFARDIYNLKLSRPRLAVLSACTTGVERYYNGEGMIGMARTFLAAGVPVVVASRWPVDSVPTMGLMTKFHEYRRVRKLPTVEALRLAQTEMINNSTTQYSHPYYWAPFVTIGGYSSF